MGPLTQTTQSTGEPTTLQMARHEGSFNSWLREYGKDAPIAVFSALAILAYLLLHYVWRVGHLDVLPLYLALLAGGIPLLLGLLRQAFKLEFGADWLAGISIVTGTLLHEYLVACIVVLMLSGEQPWNNTRRDEHLPRCAPWPRECQRAPIASRRRAPLRSTCRTSSRETFLTSIPTRFAPWMAKSLRAGARWTNRT